MRLCERDGAFDFAAYNALNTAITWEEALRINAALVVINDERVAYGEWRASGDKDKPGAAGASPVVELTLDDYKRELTDAREQLDAAQQMLVRHRRAVHTGTDEGRLGDSDVAHFELIVGICKRRIEGIEDHLQKLAEAAARGEALAHPPQQGGRRV